MISDAAWPGWALYRVPRLTAVIESPDVFQATAAAIILSNQTPARMISGP
jgi:hypothetical protein